MRMRKAERCLIVAQPQERRVPFSGISIREIRELSKIGMSVEMDADTKTVIIKSRVMSKCYTDNNDGVVRVKEEIEGISARDRTEEARKYSWPNSQE